MKADHAQVNRLLKTARGQIDGILKMVEEDRYCLDVSSQIMAAQSIGDPDARFVLQGRDENTGELRPSEKSILLGETDEVLVRPAE